MSVFSRIISSMLATVFKIVFTTVLVVFLVFYLFMKWRYTYWIRKGVVQLEPELLFGNTKGLITGETSLAENFYDIYCKVKNRNLEHCGVYMLTIPSYMPISLPLIKEIMQTQYQYFDSHGLYNHEKDVLSSHLFTIEGESWRKLRQKLTPAFSSGKIKMMFDILIQKAEILEKVTKELARKTGPIKIKDLMERYTIDVIASYVFGFECSTLENPDSEFKRYGTKVFKPRPLKNLLEVFLPWKILPYLGHRAMDKDVEVFFRKLVKTTKEYREKNNLVRNDLLQLLLQLKNVGTLNDIKNTNLKLSSKEDQCITDDEVVAQCFLFFSAGYETSASTATFALYELAKNPAIQEKARIEIVESVKKNNNRLSYEMVMDMEYLEKIINETLRKYPPLAVLPRKCTRSRCLPGTNVTIEKGTIVWIPVWGIHRDPEYYKDPEVFDPERFSKENIASRPDYTWLPFGEGPRLCIGKRFGILQTKMALICMLKNYKFCLDDKTSQPLRLEQASFTLNVKGDIWLNIEKI